MANNKSIQFLRGNNVASVTTETLNAGQPCFDLTTKELRIGSKDGASIADSGIVVDCARSSILYKHNINLIVNDTTVGNVYVTIYNYNSAAVTSLAQLIQTVGGPSVSYMEASGLLQKSSVKYDVSSIMVSNGNATVYGTTADVTSTAVYTFESTKPSSKVVIDDCVSCMAPSKDYWRQVDSGEITPAVGDLQVIEISGVPYLVRCIGLNHDTKTAGGTAKTTWEMVGIHATTVAFQSNYSTYGNNYKNSTIRNTLNSTLYNSIDSNLKSYIKQVNKQTCTGYTSSSASMNTTLETTQDYLFLLSEYEIYGGTSYSGAQEGVQYTYYANLGVTTSSYSNAIKYRNGSTYFWWERSPLSGGYNFACGVAGSGNPSFDGVGIASGVSFGFCV